MAQPNLKFKSQKLNAINTWKMNVNIPWYQPLIQPIQEFSVNQGEYFISFYGFKLCLTEGPTLNRALH